MSDDTAADAAAASAERRGDTASALQSAHGGDPDESGIAEMRHGESSDARSGTSGEEDEVEGGSGTDHVISSGRGYTGEGDDTSRHDEWWSGPGEGRQRRARATSEDTSTGVEREGAVTDTSAAAQSDLDPHVRRIIERDDHGERDVGRDSDGSDVELARAIAASLDTARADGVWGNDGQEEQEEGDVENLDASIVSGRSDGIRGEYSGMSREGSAAGAIEEGLGDYTANGDGEEGGATNGGVAEECESSGGEGRDGGDQKDDPGGETIDSDRSELYEDPLTMDLLVDPVRTPCGHTFSRKTISDWVTRDQTCPMCRTPICGTSDLMTDDEMAEKLANFKQTHERKPLEVNPDDPFDVYVLSLWNVRDWSDEELSKWLHILPFMPENHNCNGEACVTGSEIMEMSMEDMKERFGLEDGLEEQLFEAVARVVEICKEPPKQAEDVLRESGLAVGEPDVVPYLTDLDDLYGAIPLDDQQIATQLQTMEGGTDTTMCCGRKLANVAAGHDDCMCFSCSGFCCGCVCGIARGYESSVGKGCLCSGCFCGRTLGSGSTFSRRTGWALFIWLWVCIFVLLLALDVVGWIVVMIVVFLFLVCCCGWVLLLSKAD